MNIISSKVLLISIFLFASVMSIAQDNQSSANGASKVVIYGDLLIGVVSTATVNLEGKVLSNSSGNVHLYLRGGYGGQALLLFGSGDGGLAAVTLLKNRGKNHLDISGGVFSVKTSDNERLILPLLDIGFRWQKPEPGFVFRAKLGIAGIGVGVGFAF